MAAHKNVLYIVCFSCLLIGEALAADGPYLQVDPATIDVGITKVLAVSCSFILEGQTVMQEVVELVIYSRRPELDSDFKKVASVNASNGLSPVTEKSVNTSGHVFNDEPSFLNLLWHSPSENEAREYKCDVRGKDDQGQTKILTATASANLANTTSATPISSTQKPMPIAQTVTIEIPTTQTPAALTPTTQAPATQTPIMLTDTTETPSIPTITKETATVLTPTTQRPKSPFGCSGCKLKYKLEHFEFW